MSAALFEQFRKNLSVKNSESISTSYGEITKRLNKDYWDLDSDSTHCLQVGSYGRKTAINGVSDLDMVFELPTEVYERISEVKGNGPSQLLQEVRSSIKVRYPRTEVRGDGQVVVVDFDNFRVEVLPAFKQEDGSYLFGDSNDGGSWKTCKPREEISAVDAMNTRTNRNYKRMCKMLRAWKNNQGAPMSGMLIDTLAFNFFKDNNAYDDKSYSEYPALIKDLFAYIANQPEQSYWLAPGSNQQVATKGKFQRKAKRAAAKCQEALDSKEDKTKEKLWKEVFGPKFPSSASTTTSKSFSEAAPRSTEEFIEDKFPVDIQYDLEVDCDVSHSGKDEARIRFLEKKFFWLKLGRSLHFRVISCNVPAPYEVLWKVRNVGPQAEKRNMVRGQIVQDKGHHDKFESTSFTGDHFVECYIVKDKVCIARDKIPVPIGDE